MRRIVGKVTWYIKQLFPLTYISKYREGERNRLSIWKMWFGKVYRHRKYIISGASDHHRKGVNDG